MITPAQTVGPFFHIALAPSGEAGPLIVEGVVRDGDGAPVGDALLEVWQPDASGVARAATDAEGRYRVACARPGPVPGPGDRPQAPHLLVAVFARGLLDRLYCRIYFPGEALNQTDAILALVPPSRRPTLLATAIGDDRYRFDVQLQGEDETVFLRC